MRAVLMRTMIFRGFASVVPGIFLCFMVVFMVMVVDVVIVDVVIAEWLLWLVVVGGGDIRYVCIEASSSKP